MVESTQRAQVESPPHRFFDRVWEAVDAGHAQCFLYGENVSSEWFYNGRIGRVRDLRESLVFGILHSPYQFWRRVVSVRRQELYLYEPDMDSVGGFTCRRLANANALEDALRGEVRSAGPGGVLGGLAGQRRQASAAGTGGATGSAEAEEGNGEGSGGVNGGGGSAGREGSTVNVEVFHRLTRLLGELEEPIAVVVEGLQWIAELFPGRQHALQFLEELERWQSVSLEARHLSLVVLPDLEVIEPYLRVRDSDLNAIYLGGPAIVELVATLKELQRRAAAKFTALGLGFTEEQRQRIASALKNKGFSLLNAAHKFDSFVRTWQPIFGRTDAELSEDFISAFKVSLSLPVEDIRWEDVHLPTVTRRSIDDLFARFLQSGEDDSPPKGMLLFGPPGTGKTHIARALANRGGFYFQPLKLADLKGRFIGESGKNVQRIFAEARASSPTLMFIDEVDTIFGLRGGHNQDSFANDLVNQFLAETDGVDTSRQRIFIVATTNRPDLVDPAIKSRLPLLEIKLPDVDNRRAILYQRLRELCSGTPPPLGEAEFDRLIETSDGLSGRDLDYLAKDIKDLFRQSHASPVAEAHARMRRRIVQDLNTGAARIRLAEELTGGLDNVIGYTALKTQLRELAISSTSPDPEILSRLTRMGIGMPNGVLLYGPPGNGKTFLIQSLAAELGLDFLLISGEQLAADAGIDAVIRQLGKLVDNAMRMAVTHLGILVFFDEFDAVAPARMDLKYRSAVLSAISRLRASPKIVLAAATNNYEALDAATIRAGRFDRHIEMPFPDASTLAELIRAFLSSPEIQLVEEDGALERLGESWAGAGTSISACREAVHHAIRARVLAGAPEPYTMSPSDLRLLAR